MSGPRFATNVAITVLATLVVSSIAYAATAGFHRVAEAPHPTPSPVKESPLPLPLPSAAPGPAGMFVIDEDLVDTTTGWMLVSDCPLRAGPMCQNAVVATNDGGKTWTAPVEVGPQVSITDGDMPRTIRFLNRNDGFVYGASGAFFTHDGGKSWASIRIPAAFVISIALWGDAVWLATTPCQKGTACVDELRSSFDAGRTWSAPWGLVQGFIPENSVGFASGATIWMSVAPYSIAITTDNGKTWRYTKTGCVQQSFNDYVATSNGLELWAACWPMPDANGLIATQSILVSEDGGKTWTPRSLPSSLPLPGWLVSPRPHVAFQPSNQGTFVTHDGGVTWTKLLDGSVSFSVIRFASSGWGWALDGQRNAWSSSDGGDHWSELGSLPDRLS
ncbi:MAG TPA: hypothetical protein VHO95_03750 [Candidatus Dormibacteraeota bacterium]|nr:hypothetical protein [Candidatus Dormibacteraeota bacterium]